MFHNDSVTWMGCRHRDIYSKAENSFNHFAYYISKHVPSLQFLFVPCVSPMAGRGTGPSTFWQAIGTTLLVREAGVTVKLRVPPTMDPAGGVRLA